MKRMSLRWFVTVPIAICTLIVISMFSFNYVRHAIIENNEVWAHSVADTLMPALLVNDNQQVETLMKSLESCPGVQAAELINAQGAPIASYARAGQTLDPMAASFELASADSDPSLVHLMAPITFDGLIVANLYVAVNLWPSYLRVIKWLGFLLIIPSVVYVLVKQLRLKLRFELIARKDIGDEGGGHFDVKNAVNIAMTDSDISVNYQPIQRMSDGGRFGMQPVVTWRHPSGQTLHVPPSDFVMLAEKMGLCLPFDDWLLTTACSQASNWQHQYGPLILTISISSSQFNNPTFAQKIRRICEQARYPHQLLELLVRESVIASDPQQSIQSFESFSAQSISVTVDNFGLLPGSLNVLNSLPISKVKLDCKLVKRVEKDVEISTLIKKFASEGILQDVQVMADGVETDQQLEILRSMGCILAQGNYFSAPLGAKDFETFLTEHSFAIASNKVLNKQEKLLASDVHPLLVI